MKSKTCGDCAWMTVVREYKDGRKIIGCRRTGWSYRDGKTMDGDHMEFMDPSNIYDSAEPACPAFEESPVEVPENCWPKCNVCGHNFMRCAHTGEFTWIPNVEETAP